MEVTVVEEGTRWINCHRWLYHLRQASITTASTTRLDFIRRRPCRRPPTPATTTDSTHPASLYHRRATITRFAVEEEVVVEGAATAAWDRRNTVRGL